MRRSRRPLLARILQSPRESERLRLLSAESLGKMGAGSRFALETLTETLIIDPSEAVRDAAAQALGQMGPVARPVLQQLLRHADAGRALAERHSRSARWAKRCAPAASDLRERARDKNEAETFAYMLRPLFGNWKRRPTTFWPTAVALIASDDRNIRKQSLDLLISLGAQAKLAEPQLRTLTKHERREVRQFAEQALRKIAELP